MLRGFCSRLAFNLNKDLKQAIPCFWNHKMSGQSEDIKCEKPVLETPIITGSTVETIETEVSETTEKKSANFTREEAKAYLSNHALKQKRKHELRAEKKRLLKERRAKTKETKEVGFNFNDSLKQTDYYFDTQIRDGKEFTLRKVYPYFFHWNTTAKERWFGRTIHEIYKTEFSRAVINQPIEKLILTGKIQVNGQTKGLDYVIRNGDKISHAKHRHEIPVRGDAVKVVHDDDDYLVIDKPCSIPMHPCGKYRYNSISIILAKELMYKNLRTLYRLDRLTSGCVILGKNFKAALVLDKHIKERTAVKTYICRVDGAFPEGKIVVNRAIDCASRKIGLYWLDEVKGKESLTEFERVSFNGKTSVVKCWPKTGRTHQIRIHLQYLGHPIVNDPLYNQPTIWGKGNGKGGIYEFDQAAIENNFLKIHTYEAWIIKSEQAETPEVDSSKEQTISTEPITENTIVEESLKRPIESEKESNPYQNNDTIIKKQKTENEETDPNETNTELKATEAAAIIGDEVSSKRPGFEPSRVVNDPECFECSQVYRDPEPSDLVMYLHALSYEFGDKKFETERPEWSKDDFKE